MGVLRTEVGIVGAGPAGLFLSHLLSLAGISSVVVEARSRAYIEGRVRAGVLEQGVADLFRATGVGARMDREGLVHEAIELRFAGRAHLVELADLTGGKTVTVYGQHEVVKDLVAARLAAGATILFEAAATEVDGIEGEAPRIRCTHAGEALELRCDFVAGCDGFHGICRPTIPEGALATFERAYPFAWLGILAEAPPLADHLIYANHDRGFALASMRSPQIARLYLQCPIDTDARDWADADIWRELAARLGVGAGGLRTGPILQKGVTGMRSFVVEPMQHGRLYLAGDAAHIVPPTGAKGMNLAIADVWALARALALHYREGSSAALAAYSSTCLRRVWMAQRFSWWMTSMLHLTDEAESFDRRRQIAELDFVASSRAAATALAENYVGLPLDGAADTSWIEGPAMRAVG